jgi:saccharopine dehydrogenase-like NADP-dependent oxidoreductase
MNRTRVSAKTLDVKDDENLSSLISKHELVIR